MAPNNSDTPLWRHQVEAWNGFVKSNSTRHSSFSSNDCYKRQLQAIKVPGKVLNNINLRHPVKPIDRAAKFASDRTAKNAIQGIARNYKGL